MSSQHSQQSSKRPFDEGLRLIAYCPVCETKYHAMHANVLGEDGETRLLHVRCTKCQHAILILVLVSNGGASSIGLLTDLSYEDVLKFRSSHQITINDVIDIHTVMDDSSWMNRFGIHKRNAVLSRKEKK